jgi:hypothetical protein
MLKIVQMVSELDFSNSGLNVCDAKLIKYVLEASQKINKCAVKILNLSGNKLKKEGAIEIAQALTNN